VQYSSPTEIAVCNLASVGLPSFVTPLKTFDFGALHNIVRIATYNLNRIIDENSYPIASSGVSNKAHRPVGIGIQGLAETFISLRILFESREARELNLRIAQTMYHAAVEASCDLVERFGPYKSFVGSPASKGKLQFDLWSVDPQDTPYDWNALRVRVKHSGISNSLLVALMPTVATSQITGFSESFEPILR